MPTRNQAGAQDELSRAGFRVVVREIKGINGKTRYELTGLGPLGALYVSAASEAEAWRLGLDHVRHNMTPSSIGVQSGG